MRKILYCIVTMLTICSIKSFSQDTTIVVNGKQIVLQEGGERLKVKIYEPKDGENEERELIFEGHYKDGKSYEKRHLSLNIPVPVRFKHVSFRPHWDGFSAGFTNFSDKRLENFNDIDGVTLQSGSSLEYNFNLFGHAIRFSKNSRWGIVTGAGLRWSHYRFSGMWAGSDKANDMLNMTSLKIPVLIEWQGANRLFISAGVEGIAKLYSKGLSSSENVLALRPVSLDFLLQAGYGDIGLYTRYSPMQLFESGKGPLVYPVAIGLQVYF